jgi:threonine aldolase
MLGGGMRQAGVIAAAGIVAMTKMVDRLQDDHTNARSLAHGLSKLPGLSIDMDSVQTNMVYGVIAVPDLTARQLSDALEQQHIRIHVIDSKTFRLVTHKDIDTNDIPIIVDSMQQYFAGSSVTS